jgi:hypothetical protein
MEKMGKKMDSGSSDTTSDRNIPVWAFVVSVISALVFLVALLVIAIFIPHPTAFQIFVFRIVLALAAAAFGATIPGFFTINLPLPAKGLIHAGGAIALFLLIYWFNPPQLAVSISLVKLNSKATESSKPNFIVENPIFNSQKPLYIKAIGETSYRSEPLNVSYDEVVFHKKGIPLEPENKKHRWQFVLADQNPSEEMKTDGKHYVKFGFFGRPMSERLCVVVKNTPPKIRIETERKQNGNGVFSIKGKAVNELQLANDRIRVELYFLHDGANQKINVPVVVKENAETQTHYFEFSTIVQGIFEKTSEKVEPETDFFGFKIIDQAGNIYYQSFSYGQYMAPGIMKIGFEGFANINIQKIPEKEEGALRNVVRLTPLKVPIQKLMADGDPALIIQVTGSTKKRDIKIRSNIPNPKPLTVVFRDKEAIGTTLNDQFTDNQKLEKERKVTYRVEKEDTDGTRYTSNVETTETHEPVILTLRSNVQDDRVFIDGKAYGKTRLDVELPVGIHTIRIEKLGYTPYKKEINLKETQTIWAKLEAFPPVTTGAMAAIYGVSTIFNYPVEVQDINTDKAISNAQVTIEVLNKTLLSELTDSNGFTRVSIDKDRVGKVGYLKVKADGYEIYKEEIVLIQKRLPKKIRLNPIIAQAYKETQRTEGNQSPAINTNEGDVTIIYGDLSKAPSDNESPKPFQYTITVESKKTSQAISNAKVTILIGKQVPFVNYTDSNGFARVFIDKNRAGEPGRLRVEAEGYKIYEREIDLVQDRSPQKIRLISKNVSSDPPPPPPPTF